MDIDHDNASSPLVFAYCRAGHSDAASYAKCITNLALTQIDKYVVKP
jgi:hypothetical protein